MTNNAFVDERMVKVNMRKKIFLALTAAVLALLLRWYAAISLPTDYDEPVYFTAARYYEDAIRTGHLDRIPQVTYNYESPALVKLVYGTVLSWLPSDGPLTDEVWAFFTFQTPLNDTQDPFRIFLLRQVSVGFGTLEVVILGLFSPIAALLLAIDSIAIKYSSVIYLEALPAFFSMASVLLFGLTLSWLRTRDKVSLRGQTKEALYLLLSAICLGVAAAGKYQYGVVGLAIVIFFLIWIIRPRLTDPSRYAILIGFVLITLLAFVAADPYLWPAPLGRLLHSLQFSLDYSRGEHVRATGYPFYQPLIWLSRSVPGFVNYPSQPMPSRGHEFIFQLDTLIFVLAITGLPRLFKNNPLVFTWLITSIVFLLMWNTKWPQYVLLVVGPICIAASDGVKTVMAMVLRIWSKMFIYFCTRREGKTK